MASESAAFSGMPQPFLEAMKKLFDILDTDKVGWIRLEDITERWKPSPADNVNLPKNMLASLRKVVSPEGKLTFERFCAGLKIAILRHEAERNKLTSSSQGSSNTSSQQPSSLEDDSTSSTFSSPASINRTNSMPNLVNGSTTLKPFVPANVEAPSPVPSEPNFTSGPPKPPRDPLRMSGTFSRESLIAAASHASLPPMTMPPMPVSNLDRQRRLPRRQNSHHRRHTLQGGVDVSMMKRLKQWEDEKRVLEEGLSAIRNAFDWYTNRLKAVHERLKFGPEPGSPSTHPEAVQERLNFELQSISELNQRVQRLTDTGRPGGFPSHINLAVGQATPPSATPPQLSLMERQIERLKQQNKLLTVEVGRKSNFITNLEQEKSLLIRQLFQARSLMATRPQGPRPLSHIPRTPSFRDNESLM